jgi:hypothetical protein
MNPITVSKLDALFVGMINPDYRERIKIDDALQQYKSILKIPTTPSPSPSLNNFYTPLELKIIPLPRVIDSLPEGLIRKVGKKCPNGSKTHKYKNELYCKKHNISVKKGKTPPLVLESILPKGMIIKIGKRCPNGSKTYKYKNKTVCKENII